MDEDLERLSREELVDEVKRLRRGIREHRDSSGQELCWHHPALWGLLPERTDPLPEVPDWADFLQGCIRYRMSLDAQLPRAASGAGATSGRAESGFGSRGQPADDVGATHDRAASDAVSTRGRAADDVRPPRP